MRVSAWFKVRGWNIERALFILQRVTGWVLLGYLIAHVIFVNQVNQGPQVWGAVTSIEHTLLGKIFFISLGALITFHGLNGLRIILVELGVLLPKAGGVDGVGRKPWIESRRHRAALLVMFVTKAVIIAYTALVILGG